MFEADLLLGRELAVLSADVAMEHFRRGVRVRRKADGSKVTDADLAVEAGLLELLAPRRPDDAILSEERGAIGASRRRWLLDPIDGTSYFAAGSPEQWGTHIALEVDGEIVLGLITRPVTEQCWWAVKGGGAHCGALQSHASDRVLRVGTTSELSRCTAVFWAESEDECRRRDLLKTKAHLVDQTMDCVLELVAGRLDLVICGASKPWDLAPGVVIVEEAGGQFSDPAGGRRLDLGEGWYSNGPLHRQARELFT